MSLPRSYPGKISDLPDLVSPYELSQTQINEFRKLGHTVLRQLAAPSEINAFTTSIRSAIADLRLEEAGIVPSTWERDLAIKRLVFSKRFARTAMRLLGVHGVRLLCDRVRFSTPGSPHYPWTQDHGLLPIDSENSITLWIPLVDIDRLMGSLVFADQSHKYGHATNPQGLIEELGLPLQNPVELHLGDVLAYHGWSIYAEPENMSDKMREAISITYVPEGTRVIEPTNALQARAKTIYFGDRVPGETLNDLKSPLIYIENA